MSSEVIIIGIVALIPSVFFLIRVGPRVQVLEKNQEKLLALSEEMSKVTTRLTALAEITEKRLERLEDRS